MTWFYPDGSLSAGPWRVDTERSAEGLMSHARLKVGRLPGGGIELAADGIERMIVPLDAAVTVRYTSPGGSGVVELAGRGSVFRGPADIAYLGSSTAATLSGRGVVAVAEAPAAAGLPVAVLRAADVPVEIRGAGSATRQVHNFGTPGAIAAENLIVCEVLTPAGNASSYPPHKHDASIPGIESRLEEIYYFRSEPARGVAAAESADPFGIFLAYPSDARAISISTVVRTDDVALVPHGYHGPAVAVPGYDLYYLNVMAGPDADRAWRITDDPAHAWVRAGWGDEEQDPRLPYLAERGDR